MFDAHPNLLRIAVALSGGVDSSAAAILLKEQGYAVFGITMRLPSPTELLTGTDAPPPAYLDDARRVAEILDIPHQVVDVRQIFQKQIITYFCEAYNAGHTPNPCVFCNPQIKFGVLAESARQAGADLFATGHYVKIEQDAATARYVLRAATNLAKDQSYFLYRLTQAQLARARFPLAGFTKDEIRQKARAGGLQQIAEKPESQENCFMAGQRYQEFLHAYLPASARIPGPIIDTNGNIVGQHEGIQFYTIGQRRGLRVAVGEPRYVVAINAATHTVVIGSDQDLLRQEFTVRQANFVALAELSRPLDVQVKIRYRHTAAAATISPGRDADAVRVRLHAPQRAITPGQSAVFYADDLVIGGGVIAEMTD